MEPIVQRKPRVKSTYNYGHPLSKNRSPTHSIESFNNLAGKIRAILYRNPREARYEIVLSILIKLSKPEINRIRKVIFGYFRKNGINAVANIEATTDGFDNPTDTVHFHILTDDIRGKSYLKKFITDACLMTGLRNKEISMARKNEFKVNCRHLTNYRKYIRYFTKHNRPDKIFLFTPGRKGQPGSSIQRFYFIGDWLIDAEGKRKTVKQAWAEIRQEMQEKQQIKKEQEAMKVNQDQQTVESNTNDPPPDVAKLKKLINAQTDEMLSYWQRVLKGSLHRDRSRMPDNLFLLQGQKRGALLWAIDERIRLTDFRKLNETVGRKNDTSLCNWFSILLDVPKLTNEEPPGWLGWYLVQGRRRKEILNAIWARLRFSTNPDVIQHLKEHLGIVLSRQRVRNVRRQW